MWVSPTGHNDPNYAWTGEINAYDGDIDTYAYVGIEDIYVEFTHSSISCDKIRVICRKTKAKGNGYPDILLDVYYSGDWHNIFAGRVSSFSNFVEYPIGSIEDVIAIRICITAWKSYNQFRVYEVEFNEVETGLIHGYIMNSVHTEQTEEMFGYYMKLVGEFGYYMNPLV